jgi:hypothetical protein
MCINHSESDSPVLFVFQCSALEYREWRDGILQELDRIEDLLRASRQMKITDARRYVAD